VVGDRARKAAERPARRHFGIVRGLEEAAVLEVGDRVASDAKRGERDLVVRTFLLDPRALDAVAAIFSNHAIEVARREAEPHRGPPEGRSSQAGR